jgi:hypothetical protein
MGKIKLNENQFKIFLKHAILEQNEEEYHKISPEEYKDLLKLSGYHGKGISKLPMFKGKPIWITGDLDISDTPTDSLGNVQYVQGRLNISNTKISDISNLKTRGYIQDYGTPIERKRKAEILRQKLEIEWQKELALLEEDKARTYAEFKNSEARLNEIETKLEAYRIEDHNLKLDRWSLDPALYIRK